jgi:hypothetical protein
MVHEMWVVVVNGTGQMLTAAGSGTSEVGLARQFGSEVEAVAWLDGEFRALVPVDDRRYYGGVFVVVKLAVMDWDG